YAVERRRAEAEHARRLQEEAARREAELALLAERERAAQQERELRAIQQLSHPPSAVTSAALGLNALRRAAPDDFDAMLGDYSALVQRALERRAYRVDHDLSSPLRALADRLGFLGAGPRDVVELHTGALRDCLNGATAERAQALVGEGRVLLVELMGLLISYYRTYRHQPT
ncbi:MAG TPA: response regulator, partial [Chloroflexota bacterium]|nr:response regulator [Chloroflexota bacterium]